MATVAAGLKWFDETYGDEVDLGIAGTPYSADLVAAIAIQETFFDVWGKMFGSFGKDDILEVCVGDTIDASGGRTAFPTSKAALLAAPQGATMFAIARAALGSISAHSSIYKAVFDNNPDKFCHGFGIFQYDIQHFGKDHGFFLNRDWRVFSRCMIKLVIELDEANARAFGARRDNLTHDEQVYVAIAYNRGNVDVGGGFDQGFGHPGERYGTMIDQFMTAAASA